MMILIKQLPKRRLQMAKKKLCNIGYIAFDHFGGVERIRTAVRGFADRCLTTRPRHHFIERGAKVKLFLKKHPENFFFQKIIRVFSAIFLQMTMINSNFATSLKSQLNVARRTQINGKRGK